MNLTSKYPVTIFRNEYQGKVYYKAGLSKKDNDGNYVNAYINCKFKKGVDLENKTKIKVTNGWLDFYKKGNETIITAFINEFDMVDGDPFTMFSDTVELEDAFLD